jgi:hypothetical protein
MAIIPGGGTFGPDLHEAKCSDQTKAGFVVGVDNRAEHGSTQAAECGVYQ